MDGRRKVLHILGALRFSGAEIMLNAAFHALSSRGFAHHILATGDHVGEYAETLRNTGYIVQNIPFKRSPFYFWRLFSFFRKNKFHIVHIHTERASFWTALTAMMAGARCVRTIHSQFMFPPRLKRVRSIQRHLMARMGVTFVASSDAVCKNEETEFGYSPIVVRNGYDPERVIFADQEQRVRARKKLAIREDATVMISVGNCSLQKNHPAIIDSLSHFEASETPVYLHCGTGHAAHGEDQQVAALGLQDNVRFLGSVPDIKDLLAASDAFVSTSSVEGGPIALLEAAAAGICCITTRVGLAGELEGLPNIYVISADPAAIAGAVRHAVGLPLAERIGRGRVLSQVINEKYAIRSYAEKYLSVYLRTLADPAAAPELQLTPER